MGSFISDFIFGFSLWDGVGEIQQFSRIRTLYINMIVVFNNFHDILPEFLVLET